MITRIPLLGVFGLLFASITYSQPILQPDSYGHLSAELYSMIAVPSAIMANGEDISWDVSAYPMNQFASLERIQAEGTPYDQAFPDANWAEHVERESGAEGFDYYAVSDTALQLLGFSPYLSVFDTGYYIEPYFKLRFPLSYTDEFETIAQLEFGAPITYRWKYSGYGTLITPLAVFTNVVKLENLNNLGMSSFWITDPLLEVLSYANFTFFNIQIPALVAGVVEPNTGPTAPTVLVDAHALTIRSAEPILAYRLVDQLGREVRSGGSSNAALVSMDISDLRSGWYILQIVSERGTHAQRIMKG
jgi:hypothetical protein